MDKVLERSLARKIVRGTAKKMKPFGYKLTKPTFLCREYPHFIAFFHFHKFSFGPYFRVHSGIHVLNRGRDWATLNGPSFEDADQYSEDSESVARYIQKLTELLIGQGLAWVERWLDIQLLLSESDSPLSADDKARLRIALDAGPDPERVLASYQAFRITPPNEGAPPNGGPATPVGNSGATEGPPSVS